MKRLEVRQALKTLELTDYEARAYVCLVRKGLLNAGDLSELAEIPHSKIYEVLARLEKRGIVNREVIESRPPRVEYSLTSKGKEITGILEMLKKTV